MFVNRRGQPVCDIQKPWKKALEAVGIEDFRWHDLRHTWASWLAQIGVLLAALQEMGKVLRWYADTHICLLNICRTIRLYWIGLGLIMAQILHTRKLQQAQLCAIY
nr:tyrosine-type recombinase/integrase [Neisseria sp. WF04]